LDEYGFAAEPKHSHLAALHKALMDHRELLLNRQPMGVRISNAVESIVFGDFSTADSLVFIINSTFWNCIKLF
jgi:hypothetical protein